jgi:L-methionine (R)-S-oxide reductase
MTSLDKSIFQHLQPRVDAAFLEPEPITAVCELLQREVGWYDWVGIYRVATDEPNMLELGAFAGSSTYHTRIPFGRGICGQVALSKETMVVADVRSAHNYLSCSLHVKSEVVIPIFDAEGNFIAQMDIDSHVLDAFSEDDLAFLNPICQRFSEFVGKAKTKA